MRRLVMILVMGLLFNTIYYDFDPTEVSVACGVIFSTVMFLYMGQSPHLPVYMMNREIFYKQRGANLYRTSSYVLASSMSQIPLSLAEMIVFGTLVHWMCGFTAEVGLFIIFELIVLLSNLVMGMWFFFLATACSHKNIMTPLCMMSILIFIFAGSIAVLMGSTGAGKTTLMDVIAGRKPGGKIAGKIMLNGYEASDLAIRRCTGYCEQMDVYSEAATIREALAFSSFLRQDASISYAKKYDLIDECIEILGLEDITK
ncbi:hypothetical protein G195_011577 [Phytophthora kernoviae 00238/432]|uniref:ABC-2 type transporter transmembrane domain-containing protein n=1 Tax=Phytophthora kernoviae 00238/432 TaxID=1284355 RepID=A0A8J4S680_9STRA|nr:hypothetical protein G195_011577 [Phytophthora kernoviae 00238/432]